MKEDFHCGDCLSVLQVHSGCKEQLSSKCPLGQCKVSVIPPTALNSIDSDGEKQQRAAARTSELMAGSLKLILSACV